MLRSWIFLIVYSGILGWIAGDAIAQQPISATASRPSEASMAPAVGTAYTASVPDAPPSLGVSAPAESDPFEPLNRGFFAFNDGIDVYALEPVARGWRSVTPRPLRRALAQFFSNLQFPVRFVGCLAQGQLVDSGQEIGRFVVNTTVGIAGLFDPASRIGLPLHPEDLSQALGTWGVGPGPYIVFPVLGPSSLRDVVDIPLGAASSLLPGLNVLNLVNTRADLIVEVREAKAASLDYYSLVRNAYLQRRRALVRNETIVPQEANDDLYELSDDF